MVGGTVLIPELGPFDPVHNLPVFDLQWFIVRSLKLAPLFILCRSDILMKLFESPRHDRVCDKVT